MREKAESANDQKRLLRRQTVQYRLELAPRGNVLVSAEANRGLANPLDDAEDRAAALLAHRVAKDSAEQPDILTERQVFVLGLDCPRSRLSSGSAWAPLNRHRRRMPELLQEPCLAKWRSYFAPSVGIGGVCRRRRLAEPVDPK